MADYSTVNCPLCGNKVVAGTTKCPVCATDLSNVVARQAQMSRTDAPGEDYLRKELPTVELPVAEHLCPQCGMSLQGNEVKCPRCSIPLVSEEHMLECPQCGALAPMGSNACWNCGVGFKQAPIVPGPPHPDVPLPLPRPELFPGPPTPQGPPTPRPIPTTSPLVPAASAGYGLTNGRGAINGTGLVNGTGITNGTRGGGRLPPGFKGRGALATRWQFLSVLIVLIVVVSSFVYLSYASENNNVAIDGRFNDWSHAQKFTMNSVATTSTISVDQWAVKTEASRLYLYLKVQGALMGSSSVDSFYLFVDSDNYAQTGYMVAGLGADFLLEIDGWNGSVQSTALSRYSSPSDQHNWTAWTDIGSLSTALASPQLEAMADMSLTLGPETRYLLLSQDALNKQSISYVVPKEGGSLIIRQEAVASSMPNGVVPYSSNLALLRLDLLAEGAGGTVQSISPAVMGAQMAGSLGPITLKVGQTQTVAVIVDTSASISGSLVTVSVSKNGVESDFTEVSIIGEPAKAYVVAPPSAIVIDGAFGDWVGMISTDTDSLPVLNPDINIDATGAVNSTLASYFYVSVKGQICNGSFVPTIKMKPTGGSGGGGLVIPTRVTGEDLLRIYIDSDRNVSTGMPISMSSKVIGADYLVEIVGMDGVIDRHSLMAYQAGVWTLVPSATVNASNDAQRIEVGVFSTAIGGSSSIDFIIETTDWRGGWDMATSLPQAYRGTSAGVMAAGIESWLIDGSTTSQSATATSNQRKLFYDGVNFWSFYWDGANTVYRYSANNGVTWSAVSNAFRTAGVNEVSIWFDPAVNIVYAVGDRSNAADHVYVQRGVVAPATHTITWAAADRNPTVSTVPMGSKHAFICKDASGYLWVLATDNTVAAPAAYNLAAVRSNTPDNIAVWTWTGNMLVADDPSANVKGSIVPAGVGSQVWAVYTYSGDMASRKYDGAAWSAETTFYTHAANRIMSTDTASPSVVVDSRGVLHCVYGDDNEQPSGNSKPHIYYRYNQGSGWSVALLLSGGLGTNGYKWPTLSLDTSTGSVYAFWYDMQTTSIVGKKNVSGVWTALTITQNAYVKQYLTSIYSVSGEQFICWQWTQNTTAPIQVVFDKIPEFSQVVVPIVFMMSLFVLIGGRVRRNRKA